MVSNLVTSWKKDFQEHQGQVIKMSTWCVYTANWANKIRMHISECKTKFLYHSFENSITLKLCTLERLQRLLCWSFLLFSFVGNNRLCIFSHFRFFQSLFFFALRIASIIVQWKVQNLRIFAGSSEINFWPINARVSVQSGQSLCSRCSLRRWAKDSHHAGHVWGHISMHVNI